MPAFRVLVNTPTPQGSTGITTGVQPSMTLGCGAMAGNITSDNVGPQHLLNVKRLAYVVRTVEEAFPDAPPASAGAAAPNSAIASAVEKFLVQRGVSGMGVPAPASRPAASPVAGIVDRFLQAKTSAATATGASCGCGPAPTGPHESAAAPVTAPPAPVVEVVDFVCEADVRAALHKTKKIYIGPKTIVTPAARELANQHDLLVVAQR
jgi:acetaldehyde dehydrogenase (acetylating)